MKKFLSLFILLLSPLWVAYGQNADETELKDLIQNSFDEIFSNHDKSSVKKYFTDDFLLLENGEIWNLDSIYNYIEKSRLRKPAIQRMNAFEFNEIRISKKRAWIAYNNYAVLRIDGKIINELHWLESALAVKRKNKWMIEMLHSTYIND